jgi:hypothetical protein
MLAVGDSKNWTGTLFIARESQPLVSDNVKRRTTLIDGFRRSGRYVEGNGNDPIIAILHQFSHPFHYGSSLFIFLPSKKVELFNEFLTLRRKGQRDH